MYNAKSSIEIQNVKPGEVTQGIIVHIVDGKVKDFIKNEEIIKKFKNIDSDCINMLIEFNYQGRIFKIEKMFTFMMVNGQTAYSPKSNIGKYKRFYGKLPEAGDVVKLLSDSDGYFRLMM